MENMQALVGQTLGQYRIIDQIGEGGMASVFKAFQPGLNRDVALKVLPPSFAKKGDFTERFTREAQAIGNLHHPNILPVYDSGQDKGYSYLVMRYIPNASTLADEMKRPLKTGRVIELIGQIAAALDHAHQAGIIHRDIKPSNVLLDGKWALLSDFGLAKMVEGSVELTETGVGMGTPAYMSPEQGMGKKVDHRTDIYALGIILYEMLTGQVPHRAETPIATVMKRINEPLPLPRRLNPDIPEAVERVILKALAVDPGHRFASAGELAQALKAAFGERPDEVLAEVNEAYVQPASKTAAPAAQATSAPTKSASAGLALPLNLAGFGLIGGLVLLVLVGIGVLIAFQLAPERSPITWQYVLDMSADMAEPFPGESASKWEAAQQSLKDDLATAPAEINVGLRVFGQGQDDDSCQDTKLLVEPNPKQIANIQNKLATLSPSGSESPLTEAMIQAFNDLELAPDKRNALIVLTDGADSCDPAGPEQLAGFMERLNIRVDTYIVGLGVTDPAAEENLLALASASDGLYVPAHNTAQLREVLKLIKDNLEAEGRPSDIAQLIATATPTPAPAATPTPVPSPSPTPTEAAPAAMTAQQALEIAQAEALQWQADAVLSEMQTTALDLLDADGNSTSWSASFYSPSAGAMNTFMFINGVLQPATPVTLPNPPNLVPFDDSVILDTRRIYETAAAAGGSNIMAEGYEPSAALTQYPLDETRPTWYINYMDPANYNVVFTVIIDARTGEVIQAIDLR
ncbi:MAG: serine/threonine-protein kinase [Chloroflexota bacterium]